MATMVSNRKTLAAVKTCSSCELKRAYTSSWTDLAAVKTSSYWKFKPIMM